jgi:hypothetical protein
VARAPHLSLSLDLSVSGLPNKSSVLGFVFLTWPPSGVSYRV